MHAITSTPITQRTDGQNVICVELRISCFHFHCMISGLWPNAHSTQSSCPLRCFNSSINISHFSNAMLHFIQYKHENYCRCNWSSFINIVFIMNIWCNYIKININAFNWNNPIKSFVFNVFFALFQPVSNWKTHYWSICSSWTNRNYPRHWFYWRLVSFVYYDLRPNRNPCLQINLFVSLSISSPLSPSLNTVKCLHC